ncbi:hypothetical protein AB0K12_28490 [Nonomuraea sp. NPDC049419]|uniref:hypothetical protein n=1 Tax=Nonomuraea sp. NPDC049419 TaxID=3155772 RepID=UPI0034266E0C
MLRELGTVTHHGEDAGLAAVEFLARTAVSYELLIGYLHTLRLVQAEGVDVVEIAAIGKALRAAVGDGALRVDHIAKGGNRIRFPPLVFTVWW